MSELSISSLVIMIGAAWLLSFGIGCIIVFVWKKGMDTARGKTHACDYIIPGSLSFQEKKDRYLYSTVNKIRKQKSSSTRIGRR